jgi:YHS domain-containing protein
MNNSLVSLLGLVAIGVVACWIIMGWLGRGAMGRRGRAHGRDSADGHARPASDEPVDPVCGMAIAPAQAVGTRLVSGETFSLCSQTCLDAFDKDPDAYARRSGRASSAQPHQHAHH